MLCLHLVGYSETDETRESALETLFNVSRFEYFSAKITCTDKVPVKCPSKNVSIYHPLVPVDQCLESGL